MKETKYQRKLKKYSLKKQKLKSKKNKKLTFYLNIYPISCNTTGFFPFQICIQLPKHPSSTKHRGYKAHQKQNRISIKESEKIQTLLRTALKLIINSNYMVSMIHQCSQARSTRCLKNHLQILSNALF